MKSMVITFAGLLVVAKKPSRDRLGERWVAHLRQHCGHSDCADHKSLRDECMDPWAAVDALCGIGSRATLRRGTRDDEDELRYGEARICSRCWRRAKTDVLYQRFVSTDKNGRVRMRLTQWMSVPGYPAALRRVVGAGGDQGVTPTQGGMITMNAIRSI